MCEQDDQTLTTFELEPDDIIPTSPPLSIFVRKENSSLKNQIKIALQNILDSKLSPITNDMTEKYKEISKAALTPATEKYIKQYLEPASNDYKTIQSKTTKNENRFQKNWRTLPTYQKPTIVSLVIAIDSVFLGFILALICIRIKIIITHTNKNTKKVFLLICRFFDIIINKIINFLNAIPLAIQALFMFNVLSVCELLKQNTKLPFYATLIVMSLNSTANLTKIMLNHMKFLNPGQIEVAYALGLNQKQVFRYIIFEQTLKRTIPSVSQQFIVNIKDTALFSIMGLASLLWIAQRNTVFDYDIWTTFIIISAIHLIIVFLVNNIINRQK